jgi:hypothetical protein
MIPLGSSSNLNDFDPRPQGLSLEQTSALFSILKHVFEAAFGADREHVSTNPPQRMGRILCGIVGR